MINYFAHAGHDHTSETPEPKTSTASSREQVNDMPFVFGAALFTLLILIAAVLVAIKNSKKSQRK